MVRLNKMKRPRDNRYRIECMHIISFHTQAEMSPVHKVSIFGGCQKFVVRSISARWLTIVNTSIYFWIRQWSWVFFIRITFCASITEWKSGRPANKITIAFIAFHTPLLLSITCAALITDNDWAQCTQYTRKPQERHNIWFLIAMMWQWTKAWPTSRTQQAFSLKTRIVAHLMHIRRIKLGGKLNQTSTDHVLERVHNKQSNLGFFSVERKRIGWLAHVISKRQAPCSCHCALFFFVSKGHPLFIQSTNRSKLDDWTIDVLPFLGRLI